MKAQIEDKRREIQEEIDEWNRKSFETIEDAVRGNRCRRRSLLLAVLSGVFSFAAACGLVYLIDLSMSRVSWVGLFDAPGEYLDLLLFAVLVVFAVMAACLCMVKSINGVHDAELKTLVFRYWATLPAESDEMTGSKKLASDGHKPAKQ